MPIGVLINAAAVILGGLLGTLLSRRIPDELKDTLTGIFGICAMGMGIASLVLMRNMPPVVLAVVLGTLIGWLLKLGRGIRRGAEAVMKKTMPHSTPEDGTMMLTALVLFCASGTGIYGSLCSGMIGDHSILIAKSVLDFFTAMIFACRLRASVSLIALPQLAILLLLFYSAKLILPLADESCIADFKACGGFILLATGLTIMKVREFPMADMLPAMVLVMPLSSLWTKLLLPLFG